MRQLGEAYRDARMARFKHSYPAVTPTVGGTNMDRGGRVDG